MNEAERSEIGENVIKAPAEHQRIKINKWRVREGIWVYHSQVIMLYEVVSEEQVAGDGKKTDADLRKLKADKIGLVKRRLYKEGDVVPNGAVLLELVACLHTTVVRDMCADCGADLRQNENGTTEASVPMVHSVPDLKVTQKEAQKIGRADTRRLLDERKLVLLVDLDQTIIHTTNDNVPNNVKGIYHFQLYGRHSPWYHTRLRPGTAQFLANMCKYFELHICTFGARNYAHTIAKFLDPEGKYFSQRILSRDECLNALSKTDNLKALFPNGDSMVCIIDDREDVWNLAPNLIQVKPYHFFQHTGDINAPPGLSKNELDGEGVDFEELKDCAAGKATKREAETPATDDAEEAAVANNSKKPKLEENNANDDEQLANEEADAITATTTTSTVTATTENNEAFTNATEDLTDQSSEQKENESDAESDSSKDNTQTPTPTPTMTSKFNAETQELEIEDADDYLLHLESILLAIHKRFYDIFDETHELPDLKVIVPKIRSEVLRGQSLVFSGLVPTNMQLDKSRAYLIAHSLGANVTQNIGPETTHLVAVTAGTYKVNAAKKHANVKIVNANWLWSCAERWEHVDELLFPLDRNNKIKQRVPPQHCHSPQHVVNYNEQCEIAAGSGLNDVDDDENNKLYYNPLLSFSPGDWADMNEEFNEFFDSDDEDSSSEDEHANIEVPPVERKRRKSRIEQKQADRTHDFFTRSPNNLLIDNNTNDDDEAPDDSSVSENSSSKLQDDDEDNEPVAKFKRGEAVPSDFEIDSDSNNSDNANPDEEDDGKWNLMGAALEREFLGLD